MSKIDCGSCNDLRENAPEFVQNGVTDEVCASLQNDTGFNPNLKTLHTDCEDLHDANDCLIGRFDDEVESYDVCDWKPFMHKFLPNLYEFLKASICAICGIWKKIWEHDCEIKFLSEGASFTLKEESQTSDAYIIPGKGVSYDNRGDDPYSSNITLAYIAGGLVQGGGSCTFHSADWSTSVKDIEGNTGKGNSYWTTANNNIVDGGELVYEIRIKKKPFGIKAFFNGFGQQANMGGFDVSLNVFREGQYAYGQHGKCDTSTGDPGGAGMSRGHRVPDGWEYLQLRMTYVDKLITNGTTADCTPRYLCGIRIDSENAC